MKIGKRQTTAGAALALIAALLVGGTAGCGKARLPNMLGKSDEIQLGRQLAQETERKYRVITSGPDAERLQRVAERLIPLAKRDYDVPYTIKLLDSKEINAFAAPGGPVYFYKGLVDLAETDDELASVVGHELAHITRRHSAKQVSDAMGKQGLAAIILGASRAGNAAYSIAGLALQLDQLTYSRTDEDEADATGFRYLVEAGYDPDAMASFFRKMGAAEGGGGGPEFLRSHPVTSKRVQRAQERAEAYKRTRQSNP